MTGAVVVGGGLASAAGVDLKCEPQFVLVPAAGIALCLLLAPHRTGGPGVLAFVGRESLVFYVSHFVTVWAVHSALRAVGFDDPVLAYVLGVCSALVVGGGLAQARRWRAADALFHLPGLPLGSVVSRPQHGRGVPRARRGTPVSSPSGCGALDTEPPWRR